MPAYPPGEMRLPDDASEPPLWVNNPLSIKHYVKRFIDQNRGRLAHKVVIDTPAGSGITAQLLYDAGATVHAFDLFPEYFKPKSIACRLANVLDGLPIPDATADFLICQEGIEHFSDQYRVLREFNRVLKIGGSLIVTTPNYSNLHSRLSYFGFETECLFKKMPPNEIDSIWMVRETQDQDIYLGHYFLLGIQRLRGLAKLAGFRIKEIRPTRLSVTSVLLLPLAYPFLLFSGWWTYGRCRHKFHWNRNFVPGTRKFPQDRKNVFRELMALNINLRVLLDRTLFVEFEKEAELATVKSRLRSQHQSFDVIP